MAVAYDPINQPSSWYFEPVQVSGNISWTGSQFNTTITFTESAYTFNLSSVCYCSVVSSSNDQMNGTYSASDGHSGTFVANMVPAVTGAFTNNQASGSLDPGVLTATEESSQSLTMAYTDGLTNGTTGDFTLSGTAVANFFAASGSISGNQESFIGLYIPGRAGYYSDEVLLVNSQPQTLAGLFIRQ